MPWRTGRPQAILCSSAHAAVPANCPRGHCLRKGRAPAAWRPFWEHKLLLHPGGWGVLMKRVPLCALHPGQRTSVCPPAPSPPCCAGPPCCVGGGHSRCPWGTPTAGGKEMTSLSSSLPVAPAPPARPLGCFSAGFFLGRPRASHTFLVFERWGSLGWGAGLEEVRGASRKV